MLEVKSKPTPLADRSEIFGNWRYHTFDYSVLDNPSILKRVSTYGKESHNKSQGSGSN